MLVGDDHRRLGYDEYELYKYRLDSPDTNRNPDTNRLSGTIPSELGLLTKLSESLLCVYPRVHLPRSCLDWAMHLHRCIWHGWSEMPRRAMPTFVRLLRAQGSMAIH